LAIDLFTSQTIQISNITLEPYQVKWLRIDPVVE
jgi:hypothetical protein